MKILLHSACDDVYAPLLLDMMESLGEQLQKYDFGLLDLGLSDSSKDKIRKLKPDVIFKKAKWFFDLPESLKSEFSQATAARPFIKELFPNYDGYMQVDADLWFLDSSAVDDYIKAAEKTGFAISTETHNAALKVHYRARFTKIFGRYFFRGIKSCNYGSLKRIYGTEVAIKLSSIPRINAGLYFIHANSPIWEAWKKSMLLVDWYKTKNKQVCDQTCLFHALFVNKLPHTLLNIHYNWIMFNESELLLDKKNKCLLDPLYPHTRLKVIHLIEGRHKIKFNIKTIDGEQIKTRLTRTEFLKAVS